MWMPVKLLLRIRTHLAFEYYCITGGFWLYPYWHVEILGFFNELLVENVV